jgi:hypothetical protein
MCAQHDRITLSSELWDDGRLDGVQIYGNTFVTDRGLIRAYSYNLTGSLPRLFGNNIVYATTDDPLGAGPAILPSDYNVWYPTRGAWNTGEPDSVYADPGTAYDVRGTSPAIDAGATIANAVPRDFRGATRCRAAPRSTSARWSRRRRARRVSGFPRPGTSGSPP